MRWLFNALSLEPEVAFLLSVGDKRWAAVQKQAFDGDRRIGLWHVPSGPLPLLRERGQPESQIEDPFASWKKSGRALIRRLRISGPVTSGCSG